MSIKNILIPSFVLAASCLVACGASDAFIGDTAGGGSAGTTSDAAGKTGASGGSENTSAGTTGIAGSTASGGTASGGTASGGTGAGTSSGGSGGECSGHFACPAIFCSGPLEPATAASHCCPVCGTGGSGGGPASAGGESGSASGSGGAADCSKPHVCPLVLYQCAPGQPETPPGECCQVCVSTGGAGGSN